MILPFWDRVRTHICRWFGHREVTSRYDVCCSRCHRLLRGPLNMTDADRRKATAATEDHQ